MKTSIRYQLHIELAGISPPVWRRLIVPADCTMEALHCAIQAAMGWEDYHLYAFLIREGREMVRRVEIPDPDDMWDPAWHSGPRPEDSAKVRLCDFAGPGDSFIYDYDFGDGWRHEIRVEKVIECDDITAHKAECLDGARACPPEDCGGIWGYQAMLEALALPQHERDEEMTGRLEWLGTDWDAEAFDPQPVNKALARWKPAMRGRMYQGICE